MECFPNNNNEFIIKTIALIYSEVGLNYIWERSISTKYYEKTKKALYGANEVRFKINYKLAKTHICNKRICIY